MPSVSSCFAEIYRIVWSLVCNVLHSIHRLLRSFCLWFIESFGFCIRKQLDHCFRDPHHHLYEEKIKENITKQMKAKGVTVTKIHNVMSRHCKVRWERAWTLIGDEANHLVLFHGTSAGNLQSIINRGLVVPGFMSGVPVRNGSAYGNGIYLSSDPTISLGYVKDEPKMLVCLVLHDKNLVAKYDSIYVVKDSSLVLPCFVVEYVPTYLNTSLPSTSVDIYRMLCIIVRLVIFSGILYALFSSSLLPNPIFRLSDHLKRAETTLYVVNQIRF